MGRILYLHCVKMASVADEIICENHRENLEIVEENFDDSCMNRVSHHLNAVRERHGFSPTLASFRDFFGSCCGIDVRIHFFVFVRHCYGTSSDVHASSNEREAWRSFRSDVVTSAITRVRDDSERSIKALLLLVLNHR